MSLTATKNRPWFTPRAAYCPRMTCHDQYMTVTTSRIAPSGQPAYADRRYASPINLPVILMALALWAIIGLVVLLVV